MPPLKLAILGAGGRGTLFAQMIASQAPGRAEVVAVADPSAEKREAVARLSSADVRQFSDWREFAQQPCFCDGVIITLMDQLHAEAAIACLERGYHVLLEKPMAVTLEDCRAIVEARARAGTVGSICHSLRYHKAYQLLKETIDSGVIGEVMTLDHLEQVAWWHHAHSFVRGNWGNEGRSTFMLLAKSCHDIDYLSFLVGRPCVRVASSGHLSYFRPENAPPGSTERCMDPCPLEPTCPYAATKWYGKEGGSLIAAATGAGEQRRAQLAAIHEGPLGRCVWRSDNDVVDHQVVLLEYEGGLTASFTMTAFTANWGRKIRIHGTLGEAFFTEDELTVKTFADGNETRIRIAPESGGHGGGDARVLSDWTHAIHENDPLSVTSSFGESLATHAIVFAAERARRERRVVEMEEFQLAGV